MIDYRSDNTGRAAPEILDAILLANAGTALGYGADEWTARLQERFTELFETPVRVFPVATGTAANALALAATSPSWGVVYCSEAAHINTSEANAAGFFGGGLKLTPVAGDDGRINPDAFARTLAAIQPGQLHRGQPAAVNITQASDLGTVYPLDEIRAIAEIVVFNLELADGLAVQLRRAGQVWSKMRFASAQLMAYIENGLWLNLAAASNTAAARIATGIAGLPGLRLVAPVEVNELFLELPSAAMDALERDGFQFYRRSANLARFVCRFDTSEAETDALIAALRRHCAAAPARAAE